jgi:hypothetical protein
MSRRLLLVTVAVAALLLAAGTWMSCRFIREEDKVLQDNGLNERGEHKIKVIRAPD